jgi:transposase-like protein
MTSKISLDSFVASQILGDGHINRRSVLEIKHESQWSDYVIWKRNLATTLGLPSTEIKLRQADSSFGFQTRACVGIDIRNVKYSFHNPSELVHRLDSLGLLLWWLDDGCLSIHEKNNGTSISRFGYLCTECFDRYTNELISNALYSKFGIKTKVHVDTGSGQFGIGKLYYRLYLNAENMRLMIDTFREHIPEIPNSLLYKINMDYRPNRLLRSLELSLNYNF